MFLINFFFISMIIISNLSPSQQNGGSGVYQFVNDRDRHKVKIGETLYLECSVNHLQDNPGVIMLWKKGHRVLTAGTMKVRRDDRIQLEGSDLKITDMGVHDGGQYSCEVETDASEPLAVVHTVEILVPPTVRTEPPSGEITVRAGTTVTLECRANGNPSPTVVWSKRTNSGKTVRVSGEHSNNGMTMALSNVDRKVTGVYQCEAHNGVGNSAVGKINLKVLYEPTVRVEDPIMQGGGDQETVLTCIVHSEPSADVTWYKNTMLLDHGSHYRVHHKNRRHQLIIDRVGVEDFANYSCHASNSLGKSKAHIQLRGNPGKPVFLSKVVNVERNAYKISWLTQSYEAIQEYRLLYRKLPVIKVDSTGEIIPDSPWNIIMITSTGGVYDETHQWFTLRGLTPDKAYEAKVQARNKYGWSDQSQVFSFTTDQKYTNHQIAANNGDHISGKSVASRADRSTWGRLTLLIAVISIILTYIINTISSSINTIKREHV